MSMEKADRTYDADGFRRRAACLCYRDASQKEVLLVTSLRHPNEWIVPGGGIEENETPREAAHRELWEEAGVHGQISAQLGIFEVDEKNITGLRRHRTHVFSMVMENEDATFHEEVLGRRRRWFPTDEAKSQLRRFKPIQCSYFGSCSADVPPPSTSHCQLELSGRSQS